AIFKSFATLEEAQNHHQEAKETGILELLKREVEPSNIYIVTKGIAPGVFERQGCMMKNGLGFCGGEVQFLQGKALDAKQVFLQWEAQGHVRTLSIH
ncbi:hypothetical protein BT96DRAFT_777186, partial [Gymnopus androsaceus JB14]